MDVATRDRQISSEEMRPPHPLHSLPPPLCLTFSYLASELSDDSKKFWEGGYHYFFMSENWFPPCISFHLFSGGVCIDQG